MRDFYRLIGEANAEGQRVVLATVAETRGSTPQQRGAKMLFFADGKAAGTVGGGCIEAKCGRSSGGIALRQVSAAPFLIDRGSSQRGRNGLWRDDGYFC